MSTKNSFVLFCRFVLGLIMTVNIEKNILFLFSLPQTQKLEVPGDDDVENFIIRVFLIRVHPV